MSTPRTSAGFNHVINTLALSLASENTTPEQKKSLIDAIDVLTLVGENPQKLFWDEHEPEMASEKLEDISDAYGLDNGQTIQVKVGFVSGTFTTYMQVIDEDGETYLVVKKDEPETKIEIDLGTPA